MASKWFSRMRHKRMIKKMTPWQREAYLIYNKSVAIGAEFLLSLKETSFDGCSKDNAYFAARAFYSHLVKSALIEISSSLFTDSLTSQVHYFCNMQDVEKLGYAQAEYAQKLNSVIFSALDDWFAESGKEITIDYLQKAAVLFIDCLYDFEDLCSEPASNEEYILEVVKLFTSWLESALSLAKSALVRLGQLRS